MGSFDISLLREDLSLVRRLARDLVGEDAGAEDVLQEVYRALLERPPAHTQNLRA
jgi:RNA polymerase sigma factor (sigma-70 family)